MTDQPPAPAGQPPEGQVLIYRDGTTNLQVRLDGQTVWLPQRLIAELFQVTVPNVSQHLKAIYDEGELRPEATVKQYLIVQTEGARQVSRLVDHYNLGAILAVGYRVRSSRGTQFRQWATARLSELLVKGFTLDDERIKAGRTLGDDCFEELLARIRTSGPASGCSTRRSRTSTPPASTTTPTRRASLAQADVRRPACQVARRAYAATLAVRSASAPRGRISSVYVTRKHVSGRVTPRSKLPIRRGKARR